MKKYISALGAFLLLTSAVSCSATTSESKEKKKIVPASSDSSEKSENSDKSEKSEGADNNEEKSESEQESSEDDSMKESKAELSIDEQVLWKINDVTLKATEITDDDIWGKGIKVLTENNSDKDVSFFCDALIVNDYMISELTSIEATAGNKSNDTIYLSDAELEAAGIDKIGKIELYMHMNDSETYDKIAESECITLKTSLFDEIDTEADTSGTVLLEQDGIKIIGKYVDENSIWGAAALLYIENNTDKNIIVQAEDTAVNGFMISSICSQEVYAGKKAFTTVDFLSSSLEENNITSVDTVEMKFKVLDENFNRIIESDKISFNAK